MPLLEGRLIYGCLDVATDPAVRGLESRDDDSSVGRVVQLGRPRKWNHVTSREDVHPDEDVATIEGIDLLDTVERQPVASGAALLVLVAENRFDGPQRRVCHRFHPGLGQVGTRRLTSVPGPSPLQLHVAAHLVCTLTLRLQANEQNPGVGSLGQRTHRGARRSTLSPRHADRLRDRDLAMVDREVEVGEEGRLDVPYGLLGRHFTRGEEVDFLYLPTRLGNHPGRNHSRQRSQELLGSRDGPFSGLLMRGLGPRHRGRPFTTGVRFACRGPTAAGEDRCFARIASIAR